MNNRVRAIIFRDDKLLLVRHKNIDGTAKDAWVLPGGKIDDGESITDALTREMIEETGVTPQIGDLLFVHQYKRDGVFEGPQFLFAVTNADDFENIDLTQTTHGAGEISEIGFYDTKTLTGIKPDFLYGLSPGNMPQHPRLVIRDE